MLLNIICISFARFKKLIEPYALNMSTGKVSKITVQIPRFSVLLGSKSFSRILIWVSEWCSSERKTCAKVNNFLQ